MWSLSEAITSHQGCICRGLYVAPLLFCAPTSQRWAGHVSRTEDNLIDGQSDWEIKDRKKGGEGGRRYDGGMTCIVPRHQITGDDQVKNQMKKDEKGFTHQWMIACRQGSVNCAALSQISCASFECFVFQHSYGSPEIYKNSNWFS